MSQQPDALRLADELCDLDSFVDRAAITHQAAATLRKLYAEVTALSDNALEDSQRIASLELAVERKNTLLRRVLKVLEDLDGLDTETECVTIDVDDEIAAIREETGWRPPSIPTAPCFRCGVPTSETQSVYGIGHLHCLQQHHGSNEATR